MSLPTTPTPGSLQPELEATVLFQELTDRGVTLFEEEGRLRYKPKSLLGPKDVKRLRVHKAAILEIIREQLPSVYSVYSVYNRSGADTYGDSDVDTSVDTSGSEDARKVSTSPPMPPQRIPQALQKERERRQREAEALGLVARWASEYGWIAVHDPTTGEWHDVAVKDAPDWARNEAFLRKRLYKERGICEMLNSREIGAEWRQSVPSMPSEFSGPKEGRKEGLVYDDELDVEEGLS